MFGVYLGHEKPILPRGYYYIEGLHEWLVAVGPTQRRYYVGHKCLFRQRADDYGRNFIDDRETIELPQRQLQEAVCPSCHGIPVSR